jgi:hypothetical protein
VIDTFSDPVIMDFYSENGEWEYLSFDSSVYDEYRNTQPYNMAKLEFKFRRRPAFVVMNTIIPPCGYYNGTFLGIEWIKCDITVTSSCKLEHLRPQYVTLIINSHHIIFVVEIQLLWIFTAKMENGNT